MLTQSGAHVAAAMEIHNDLPRLRRPESEGDGCIWQLDGLQRNGMLLGVPGAYLGSGREQVLYSHGPESGLVVAQGRKGDILMERETVCLARQQGSPGFEGKAAG